MKAAALFILSSFVLLFSVDALAQASRISAAGRRVDDFNKQQSKAERDAMDREMRGKKPSKEELAAAARIKAETKEDLEGLQEQYNLVVEQLAAGNVLPEFSAGASEKINKYASRLRTNIVFPKQEEGSAEATIQIPTDRRKKLREMCSHIYNFLTNPIVETPNVLDLEAAAKAKASLDAVILLSEALKST